MTLSVTELRKHLTDFPTGDDNDDVLERLIAAAETAIDQVAGTVGEVEAFSDGGGRFMFLPRVASEIGSVVEAHNSSTPVTLDEDDYQLRQTGNVLERLYNGTNPRTTWYGQVKVTYTTLDDTAQREAITVKLVEQFLDYHPGLTSETIGAWSETYVANSVYNFALERRDLLATLWSPTTLGFA